MGQIVFQATLGGQVAVAGPNTASSFTLTLPAATDTLVGKATTDTLTNKTLTSPTITGATLTTSAFNGTIGATTPSTAVVTSLTDSGLTSGRVTYAGASGLLSDSANFTWDNANARLGIAQGAPTQRLDVNGNVIIPLNNSYYLYTTDYGVGTGSGLEIFTGTADSIRFIRNGKAGTETMRITGTGNVGIGTSSPTKALTVSTNTSTDGILITGSTNPRLQVVDTTNSVTLELISGDSQATIRTDTNHPLVFGTNGTEQMTLSATGNLGLGVTPSAWSTYKAYQVGWSSLAGYAGVDTAVFSNAFFDGSYKYIGTGFASQYRQINSSHQWSIAPSGTAGNAITFTQAMTLDASGNLLIGTTSGASAQLRVHTAQSSVAYMQNSLASPNGLQIYYSNATAPNSVANEFLFFNDTSATRMTVRSNGGIANYTANNVILSDSREKTNFAPSKSYLDVICAIPVQTFNYIDQNLETDAGLTLGVVAQDVQAVAPELVSEGNWGSKDQPKMRLEIYQTDLQYALMKALQELKAEFDAYKATHP